MRAVLTRVKHASVTIDGQVKGRIGEGFLILLGVTHEDTEAQAVKLADKLTYVAYEAIPTWPLFNGKEQQLADDYDKAWEQLEKDGTLEALQQQYFGYSLFENIPEGYQKGDEL